ncbi:butyrophilin subfamily 2 member A1-like [Epinephelus lanceolatus]
MSHVSSAHSDKTSPTNHFSASSLQTQDSTSNRQKLQQQIKILSALMAPFLLLLFPLCAAASDQHVTVHPGDNVTLRCEAADVSIRAVEWTRPDLEPQYILFYRHKHSDPTHQHPSFTGRVELVHRELKDGDVSLTLKNVTSRDSGRYECRVKSGGSRRTKRAIIKTDPITVIYLEVTDLKDGHSTPLHVGLAAVFGVVAVLLLL